MATFIAKPIEVEALQFDGTTDSVRPFIERSYAFAGHAEDDPDVPGGRRIQLAIGNNFSRAYARTGDWIVRAGQFEIFDRYEFARRFSPKES